VFVGLHHVHLQEAIRTKKAGQESERAALDAIMAQGLGEGVHPLERPEVPAHIKVSGSVVGPVLMVCLGPGSRVLFALH
jgi:hypothetical protein